MKKFLKFLLNVGQVILFGVVIIAATNKQLLEAITACAGFLYLSVFNAYFAAKNMRWMAIVEATIVMLVTADLIWNIIPTPTESKVWIRGTLFFVDMGLNFFEMAFGAGKQERKVEVYDDDDDDEGE